MRAGRIVLAALLLLAGGCKRNTSPKGTIPLIEAVASGDVNEVRSRLSRGENVNAADAWHRTPLGVAVRYGNLDLAELLLAHGADVNLKCETPSRTPLHIAVEQDMKPLAKLLIARGAELDRKNKIGQTPTAVAMKAGHKQMIRLLVDHGATMTLHVAAYLGETGAVEQLLKDGVKVDAKDAEKQTALEYAAREGHVGIVELLLAAGANANGRSGGDTPLINALWYRHPDVAILLVNHGAWVEGKHSGSGDSPLRMAALDGLTELTQLLIAKGAEVEATDNSGNTALHCAVCSGHRDTAELLVSCGADLNAKGCFSNTCLHEAAERGYTGLVKWLVQKGAGVNRKNEFDQTPAVCAMEAGHRDVVELLASRGADLTLHLAAYAGDLSIVRRLLGAGANVNQQDKEGRTPLYLAAQEGNTDVVELLLAEGADVNRGEGEPWKRTPLHVAASYGRTDVVSLLIRNGADVHAKDLVNGTPLHQAAQGGHRDVVAALIAAGAEVNRQDNYKRTALFYAAMYGYGDVVEFLLSKEADVALGQTGLDITVPDPAPQTVADMTRFLLQAYTPYTVMVTDPTAVRQFLQGQQVPFDDVWIPGEADIQGLEPILRSSLEKGPPARRGSWLDAGFVLRNLAHYHREFSGFVADDVKYLICQMVLPDGFGRQSPRNAFSMIAGGGSGVATVIFDAEKRAVVDVDGNAPY